MPLTPNQSKAFITMTKLYKTYQSLMLKADCCLGKNYIARKFLEDKKYIEFDLCELCRENVERITSQDLVVYLDNLTKAALEFSPSSSRSVYIYVRRIDLINDILGDYNMKLRNLNRFVLMRWLESLVPYASRSTNKEKVRIKVLFTTIVPMKLENVQIWTVEFSIEKEDIRTILESEKVRKEDIEEILKLHKNIIPGHAIECIKYAKALYSKEENNLLTYYKEATQKNSNSTLNVEKEMPKVNESVDLIGMEEITEEIETSILYPMKLANPNIPIKKGLVLAGEAGTGKTSIGRWLAHQIKGQIYLLGENWEFEDQH